MARKPAGECTPRKRADGRWIVQPTITLADGRKRRKTIIHKEREVVMAKLLEVQNQQRKMIPFSPKNWTVGDYLDHWLENIIPHKIRLTTLDNYERAIRLHIKPTIGKKKLTELGVRDVTQALDELERDGVSSRNRQKYKQVLSSCLSHAMREELVFRNVAMIAKMPTHHSKPVIPWTATQAQYFLERSKNDRYFVAYLLLLTYGMRIGEVLGLCWSDIDFDNDIIAIRQQVTRARGKLIVQTVKTDASRRRLPLVPTVKQALIEYAEENNSRLAQFNPNRELVAKGLVFETRLKTPLNPNDFRKRYFYKLAEKYGLPRIRVHDTRHTAATLLKDMGVPIKDVQEILGHTDIATTLKIYQHGNEKIKRSALTALSNGLTETSERTSVIPSIYSQNLQSTELNPSKIIESSLINIDKTPICCPPYEKLPEHPFAFATSVKQLDKHEQTRTNTPYLQSKLTVNCSQNAQDIDHVIAQLLEIRKSMIK